MKSFSTFMPRVRSVEVKWVGGGPVLARTLLISTLSPDQIPLGPNDALLVKYKLFTHDPSGPVAAASEGGFVIMGGAPPTIAPSSGGSGPQIWFSSTAVVTPSVNGSGDVDINIGGGFSGPSNGEGVFEITEMTLLQL